MDGVRQCFEFGSVGELEFFVVGKIEFEFDEAGEMEQLVSECLQFGCYAASELCECQVFLGLGLCGDEVSHGFCLCQVHLAIEERALCELTGLSEATSCVGEPL